jgi:hypothetical protein
MIILNITRVEINPKYKKPKSSYDILNQPYDVPEHSKYEVLNVEITDEQFQKIRKAVLEVF